MTVVGLSSALNGSSFKRSFGSGYHLASRSAARVWPSSERTEGRRGAKNISSATTAKKRIKRVNSILIGYENQCLRRPSSNRSEILDCAFQANERTRPIGAHLDLRSRFTVPDNAVRGSYMHTNKHEVERPNDVVTELVS